jgi:hypothetical protein
MEQTIKSRPIYTQLALDGTGTAHLLVTDHAKVPMPALAPDFDLDAIEHWTIAASSQVLPGPTMQGERKRRDAFRSEAQLLTMLRHRLARATMGLRLYAVGSETFIWDVAELGRAAGLGRQEMHLAQAGSLRRRIYCPHCKTLTPAVTTTIVACVGCGARLGVRDHFSRRLGAFIGVQADAEEPGIDLAAAEITS